jgi:hypothetical protein
MSIQAKCEPAPILPAVIQIPKAMIPTEIKSENASFMMASKGLCLSDECQPVGKFGIDPGPPLNLICQIAKAGQAGMSWLVVRLLRLGRVLRTASGGE